MRLYKHILYTRKKRACHLIFVWGNYFYKHAIIFDHLHMINAALSRALAGRMYCLSFRHHPPLYFKLVKCKCVNIDCQDVQLKVPPGSWRWWRVAHFGAPMKFNACLLWKSITAHNLGGLLVINEWGFDGSERIKQALRHFIPSSLLSVFLIQTGIH